MIGQPTQTVEQTKNTNFVIGLQLAPSVVESGKATYPIGYVNLLNSTGSPYPAPYDIQINLTSSNPVVASIPSNVVIPKHHDYANFDVGVGNVEGDSEISAQFKDQVVTQDFRVGEITGKLSSDIKLKINIPTNQTNVNSEMPFSVYLERNGTILQAPKDVAVSLDYDRSLVQLQNDTLTIKKGSSYAMATVYTLGKSGTTYIRASIAEPPLNTVTDIQILSTSPSKLKVYVFPPKIGYTETNIELLVDLLDPSGLPTKATEDVPLSIFSNSDYIVRNLDKIIGPLGAVIKKGEFEYHLTIPFISNPAPVNYTIGASASNLGVDSANYSIVTPLSPNQVPILNQTIHVYVVPQMPANASSVVVYQIQNKSTTSHPGIVNKRTVLPNPFPIQADANYSPNLTTKNLNVISSDERIVKVEEIGGIVSLNALSSGSSYSTATISSGQLGGSANVTAILESIGEGSNATTVVTPLKPASTTIFSPVGAGRIAFNSLGYYDLSFLLLDSGKHPANTKNPIGYVITPINDIAKIPPQQSFVTKRIFSNSFENTTSLITVAPIGIDADPNLRVTSLFKLAPSTSTVQIIPALNSIAGVNNKNDICALQLIDSFGNPVRVLNDMDVNLNSTRPDIIQVPSFVTIAKNSSFVEFPITTFGKQGNSTIIAYTTGFVKSQAVINVVPYHPLLHISTDYNSTISSNQDSPVNIIVNDENGEPVENALVKLLPSVNATLTPPIITTDTNGTATILFRSPGPSASLTIHTTKVGYQDDEKTITFDVTGPVVVKAKASLFGLPPWITYVGIAGAAGGIGIFVVFFLRKPKIITEEEETEI